MKSFLLRPHFTLNRIERVLRTKGTHSLPIEGMIHPPLTTYVLTYAFSLRIGPFLTTRCTWRWPVAIRESWI